jgi:alanine racemase
MRIDMSELRAWVEISIDRLRKNYALINADKPAGVRIAAVLKDDAYGHGAAQAARVAIDAGAAFIAVVTLDEALELRKTGVVAPILMLGQRLPSELDECLAHDLTICLHDLEVTEALAKKAEKRGVRARVHLEIDTGMSRYGARWTEAPALAAQIAESPTSELEGVMSHFAMSDELDKTFANLQRARFQKALDAMAVRKIFPKIRHISNSGGFVDLPQSHYDMVRLGILPLGVYPSKVCRRIEGLAEVMSVKTRIVHIQRLHEGDKVGYGMRYTAPNDRTIAVLPIGYGDGFPRVRNEGAVLIHGKRAPLVGGTSMDAITVDITDIPQAKLWDEVVVMGTQGNETIDVHDIAALKKSVSYDVLTNWRRRLRRVYIDSERPRV